MLVVCSNLLISNWQFVQPQPCKLCIHKYTTAYCLQRVSTGSLWNTIQRRGECKATHAHKDTHTHTHSFTFTGLVFPIPALKIHGVFEDTAQSISLTGALSGGQQSLMSPLCYKQQEHISENIPREAYTVTGTFKFELRCSNFDWAQQAISFNKDITFCEMTFQGCGMEKKEF